MSLRRQLHETNQTLAQERSSAQDLANRLKAAEEQQARSVVSSSADRELEQRMSALTESLFTKQASLEQLRELGS